VANNCFNCVSAGSVGAAHGSIIVVLRFWIAHAGDALLKTLPLILLACATLAGCGGSGSAADSSGDSVPDAEKMITQSDPAVRQALFDHMLDRYLWFDQLPDLDLNDDSNADLRVLISRLRKQPEDRFSTVVNAQSFDDRFELGLVGSFGVRFFLRTETPLDMRVSTVDDFGTVGMAGIQRGDRIVAVDGVAIDELGLEGFVSVFSGRELGDTVRLRVRHPDDSEAEYQITRTQHGLNPIRKLSILDAPDIESKVAYVQVTEFIELTRTQMSGMRDFLSLEQPDELIVDMRYNPGGFVSVSRDLASSIYGASLSTDVYTVLTRNAKHRDEDFTYFFRSFENALTNLSRVFILTTGSTCSAAEEVINGLAPFIDVVTVGATTCGKPYAARPFELVDDLVIANVLESRSINANGEGDFFAGLAPTCIASDDPVLPFNNPAESLVAAALDYIRVGNCVSGVVLSDEPGVASRKLVSIGEPVMPATAIAR